VRIIASTTAIRSMRMMLSPSVSKVNGPIFPDFAARRDCSAVEAAPAPRRGPRAGALDTLRLPRGNKVPLGMSSIHPECLDSDPSDRSVAADVLLRQEPEDEEEEEDDRKKDDDDDDTDDGYSE
jgi:hypothetical protein